MNAQLSLYDALVGINVPADKARAVVSAMEQDMTTLLATKADLSNTQLLLKQEIAGFHDSLKQEIAGLRDSLRQEIGGVRDSLKQEIAGVRDSLRQEIAALRDSVKKDRELLESRMTIRLGAMQVVCMGLLLAALRLMLPH